ncbi:MAG: protein arginine kinase [Chlamydiae bacterium]|nr:protein arginine kinase [Chlamydiota bacterium]
MTEKKPLPKPFYTHSAWDENCNPLWPATSFFLHRNYLGSSFPQKMNEAQCIKMVDQLSQLLIKMQQLQNPVCLKAEDLSSNEKEFLYEHFLCRESFQNTLAGQAFIVDDTAHFLALINISDHLEMEIVDCKNKWEKAWQILSDIDSDISSMLTPSFSSKFGYLTSDLRKCGTGLSVVCYLHLPMLIYSGKLDEALEQHLEDSVCTTSLHGSSLEFIGDFVLLQNKYSLGLTEEMILRDLHISATKLSIAEKNLRDLCKKTPDMNIQDIVSRSYGLLLHSLQLQTKEVLDAISKIKLGIDLKMIEGISDSKINEVFFTCQRAHIGFIYEDINLDPQEIPRKRAEFIHKELKDSKFIS